MFTLLITVHLDDSVIVLFTSRLFSFLLCLLLLVLLLLAVVIVLRIHIL